MSWDPSDCYLVALVMKGAGQLYDLYSHILSWSWGVVLDSSHGGPGIGEDGIMPTSMFVPGQVVEGVLA